MSFLVLTSKRTSNPVISYWNWNFVRKIIKRFSWRGPVSRYRMSCRSLDRCARTPRSPQPYVATLLFCFAFFFFFYLKGPRTENFGVFVIENVVTSRCDKATYIRCFVCWNFLKSYSYLNNQYINFCNKYSNIMDAHFQFKFNQISIFNLTFESHIRLFKLFSDY